MWYPASDTAKAWESGTVLLCNVATRVGTGALPVAAGHPQAIATIQNYCVTLAKEEKMLFTL